MKLSRIGIVGALLLLSGCERQAPLTAQNDREAHKPFAVLVDNHGCKWRLIMDDSSIPSIYPQIANGGVVDCAAIVPVAPQPTPKAPA